MKAWEWDSEKWNGDMWENSDKVGGIELPHSSLLVEAAIFTLI